jgi:hypothetical protein
MGSTETLQPSALRVVPGSINVPLSQLPDTPGLAIDNAGDVAQTFVDAFNAALQQKDAKAISALFTPDGFWRDHLAVSWDFETVKAKGMAAFLDKLNFAKGGLRLVKMALDQSSPATAPAPEVMNAEQTANCLRVIVTLETTVGSGKGVVRLLPDGASWKAYSLYTTLRELKGHPEGIGGHRPHGVQHGANTGRKNWAEMRQDEMEWADGAEPAVLILGEKPSSSK